MPIYEYLCKKCGEFETTQRITDKPLTKCPTCRGKVSKLISSTSFQLKGSGWYITDYGRSGSTAAADSSEAKADAGASKSDDKGSDTKATGKATESKSSDGKPGEGKSSSGKSSSSKSSGKSTKASSSSAAAA